MSYANDAQATDPGPSPSDEDEANEFSERGGGQSRGMGTDDSGASQQFSSIDVPGFTDSMEEALGMYGPSAIGIGMTQNQFNAATGRTNYNPHPDSFFSQLFGPENVDYTAQYGGPQGVAEMNAIALDVYNNPVDAKGNVRGAEGQATAFGTVRDIDKQMTVPEMMARGVMSLTPLGLPVSMLGRTQKSIAPIGAGAIGTGYNYDATLDPASPSYAGSTGMFSGIVDALTGGAGTQAYSTAKDAISSYFDKKEQEEEREAKGSGQFGISDNRSFDAFGNVVGSPSMSSFADDIGQERAGIASLSPTDAADANMQVADASSMFSNAINFSKDITDKDKGYQFGPGKFNIDIDTRNRYAPEFQYNIPISDFLDRAFG